jgi:hypothetical protein
MCSFPAILGFGLSVAGNYAAQKSQAEQTQRSMDAQANAAIREMNYSWQNYEMERTDAFDAAVQEIENTRINALGLNGAVKGAVLENLSGNTANLLIRNAEGDTARAVASIQDNYKRKSNEIDLNKDYKRISTQDYLKNLNASAPQSPSRFANFVSTAASGLEWYTKGMNQKNSVKAAGQEHNWWTAGARGSSASIGGNSGLTYVGNNPLSKWRQTGIGRVQWFGGTRW